MRSIIPPVRWLLVLASVLSALAPGSALGQAASLKDIQRSIRERVLTEAGTSDLVYTRVDFSHCAATIQTRTLKQFGVRESRVTTTFHLASLEPSATLDTDGSLFVVRVASPGSAAGEGGGIRQIEQVIDSGRVRETITTVGSFGIRFQRRGPADVVRDGFGRLVGICRLDDPLLRGSSRP